ncbi:MAG: hypothetical protein P4L34_11455 [Paludibacter sp.]|nr:hypothetical protein [Paludibacter sp.]
MKLPKVVTPFLFFLALTIPIYSQGNTVVIQRTPEQEAAKQTEMLQQELNLTSQQSNQLYEINLRYARERQISNKRSEALVRMKNKNAEIQRVLTPEQNMRLQSKRYERSTIRIQTQSLNRNQSLNSAGFRSTTNFRSNSGDLYQRSNNRPVNPNFHVRNQSEQSGRRGATSTFRSTLIQNNQQSIHSSSGNSPSLQRRPETGIHPNNSTTQPQSTPNNSTIRSNPPVNINRK